MTPHLMSLPLGSTSLGPDPVTLALTSLSGHSASPGLVWAPHSFHIRPQLLSPPCATQSFHPPAITTTPPPAITTTHGCPRTLNLQAFPLGSSLSLAGPSPYAQSEAPTLRPSLDSCSSVEFSLATSGRTHDFLLSGATMPLLWSASSMLMLKRCDSLATSPDHELLAVLIR